MEENWILLFKYNREHFFQEGSIMCYPHDELQSMMKFNTLILIVLQFLHLILRFLLESFLDLRAP